MMMVQQQQQQAAPSTAVVSARGAGCPDCEAMRRKVREAEQAAAACAHVARAANMQQAEHDASFARVRGHMREVRNERFFC